LSKSARPRNEKTQLFEHYVFEGSCADKSTVKEVIEDLERRFSLKEIVFVGDRGMMTFENIEFISVAIPLG